MPCTHETIRCTDNVFYCCACGAVLSVPRAEEQIPGQNETPEKAACKPSKRKGKKEV